MQATKGVGPPGHLDLAPFGQQRRVVIRRFGKRAHGIGKGQRLGKVAEREGFLQPRNGVAVTSGAYYTGKQYTDEANQHSLPSFTTFDAGARYRLPVADNDVTLRANVSNLANKAYWLNSSYLGDPRTLTFSAQLEF